MTSDSPTPSAACCEVHRLGKCDAVFTCCDRCPTFFGTTTPTVTLPCYQCNGTGKVQACAEHWWVPDTSGMTRECGLCGLPERWVKEHTAT